MEKEKKGMHHGSRWHLPFRKSISSIKYHMKEKKKCFRSDLSCERALWPEHPFFSDCGPPRTLAIMANSLASDPWHCMLTANTRYEC